MTEEQKAEPKTCHRFKIPLAYAQVDTGSLTPKVNEITKMGFVMCIGEKCALWNAEGAKCWDVSAAEALAGLPAKIDTFMSIR